MLKLNSYNSKYSWARSSKDGKSYREHGSIWSALVRCSYLTYSTLNFSLTSLLRSFAASCPQTRPSIASRGCSPTPASTLSREPSTTCPSPQPCTESRTFKTSPPPSSLLVVLVLLPATVLLPLLLSIHLMAKNNSCFLRKVFMFYLTANDVLTMARRESVFS